MSIQKNSGVIAAGLALFSMFFGAGDLVWPFVVGGTYGDQNFYALLGFLVTGVSLPLLGLVSMMLFGGNYHAFFARVGKYPAAIIVFIVQIILGPIGSIPRLITLAHATLKPYIPFDISLLAFSVIGSLVILACTMKRTRIIDLLGYVLTPILLASLGGILILGFWNHPDPAHVMIGSGEAFKEGLKVGYNTLDLIASFIFAPFVLLHFCSDQKDMEDPEMMGIVFKKMVKASLIAAGLLSAMYIGLTYISSYYTPIVGREIAPVERLSAVSIFLLGPYGGFISCIAVTMTCLTTAIPIVAISAEYIRETFMKRKGNPVAPQILTLFISGSLANLGFEGIANMLSPVLQILCPALIVLSVMNIFHKLYEFKPVKTAVGSVLGITILSQFFL